MKMIVISLYDTKALVYGQPMFFPNVEVAWRSIAKAVNSPGNQLSDYPADYNICHIGSFDDGTGVLEPLPVTNLGPAAQCKQKQLDNSEA